MMTGLHLTFVFIITAVMVHRLESCASNGVCGGSCGAPAQPVCQPHCQQGYTCGNYGCYRERARVASAKTKELNAPKRNIYGLNRKQTGVKSDVDGDNGRQSSEPAVKLDGNEIFRQCCEERNLPDACLRKCTFNTYTKDVLTAMYFKTYACPIEAAAEMQFCAAQGRDHRACCARNGVATTLAGDKCLMFCDQREGNITKLDFSYISCYDRFENMKSCFWQDFQRQLSRNE